jgi:HD domain
MSIIDQAIIFAAMAHKDQTRKSTNIPYITHPFAVGMLLQKAKCSDEVIAAGILHDTLEDTSTTYEDLAEQFGSKVAKLVCSASEQDKSLPWEKRKQHTIESLKDAYLEEIQVITADKLHNLKSIQTDLVNNGEKLWTRFNRGKRKQHWYYSSIVKELAPRKKEFKLLQELEDTVKEVFGSLDFLSKDEISLLFSCVYGIYDNVRPLLEENNLSNIAEELSSEATRIYNEEYEKVTTKLDDLSVRGIEFQSNSEGPFLIASFCLALQEMMKWNDQELYKHFKRNASKL